LWAERGDLLLVVFMKPKGALLSGSGGTSPHRKHGQPLLKIVRLGLVETTLFLGTLHVLSASFLISTLNSLL